jgi:hypothetical protein
MDYTFKQIGATDSEIVCMIPYLDGFIVTTRQNIYAFGDKKSKLIKTHFQMEEKL